MLRFLRLSSDQLSDVQQVLDDFWSETEHGYIQKRVMHEIGDYRAKIEASSKAGKASAKARKANRISGEQLTNDSSTEGQQTPNSRSTKAQRKSNESSTEAQQTFNDRSTTVQRPFNDRSTNHKPITINHKPSVELPYGNSCSEPPSGDSEPDIPPDKPHVVALPTNRHGTVGEEYPVTQSQIDEFRTLYPAVDVEQQLNAMRGWLKTNPGKRKTLNGMPRFINAWLSREQDRGGTSAVTEQRNQQNPGRPLSAVDRVKQRARAAGVYL
ncbi:MAG: hypothetical protein ACK5MR_16325 [Cumulibacter sp.]